MARPADLAGFAPALPAPLAIARGQHACGACALNPLCHPPSSPAGAASPVDSRRRLAPGELLYRAGAPRVSLFAVRAGFLKACAPRANGGRHIMRFLLPGDAAGLDGYAEGFHLGDAEALGDCEVCVIPVYRTEILSDFSVRIGAHLRGLLARQLADSQRLAAGLARLTARQRVAMFLLDLSRRWSERGFSGAEFRLPMGRREIGDHLGLTMETVSRILSEFRVRGWIRLPRGGVEIRSRDELTAVLETHGGNRRLPELPRVTPGAPPR